MERIFRGKTLSQDEHFDDGEWVEGFYTRFNGKEHRIYSGYAETDCGDYYPDWFNVLPETVGQYTGLTDKNGKKIFEGDIVKVHRNEIYEIAYIAKYTRFAGKRKGVVFANFNFSMCEIIGNIYDNPELLEVK